MNRPFTSCPNASLRRIGIAKKSVRDSSHCGPVRISLVRLMRVCRDSCPVHPLKVRISDSTLFSDCRSSAHRLFLDYAVQLTVLFALIRHTVLDHPSLINILRLHLPRPRTLRACLDIAYITNRGQSFRSSSYLSLRRDERDKYLMEQPWAHILEIQFTCQMDKECMRRTCTKRAKARCKGCQTRYCGNDCQKQ